MKRILFVEDNELMLELYGALIEPDRDQWQATLASNGQHALKLLEENTFDVVASDMQMPGMNGIELLSEVRRRHPQTSRIIISGLTDQAEAADSLNCTHLFLPKPFDLQLLRATLARIGGLDSYLHDEKLRGLAGKMGRLPTFPSLYQEVMREMESPNSSIQGIAEIVSHDPGITAKLLQVANSAAIGLPDKVSDPIEAVQLLGLSTVRSLVLSAQVYGAIGAVPLKGFSPEALWSHLMKCGALARAIMHCERAPFADCEDAFTAGMLHDMGKLMLADCLPWEFSEALALAANEQIPLHEAERRLFGATHAGLAAYLFGLWGLPAAIVEAVAFHHEPEKSQLQQFSALTAVHVANALCDDSRAGALNLSYLEKIGVAHRLDDWRNTAAGLEVD
jgi:HD-like signal output (HDOD) protein/ActR/RegA family two-component response regulator